MRKIDVRENAELLFQGARAVNELLEKEFPFATHAGQEGVLVLALVARVGVVEARRLLGCEG